MSLNGLDQEAVDLFWQLSGEEEPFPRTLERPLALALPIVLVKLPHLRLCDVETWMHRRGTAFRFDCESRRVRGCLVAQFGHGLLFMDGTDPQDEQRLTLAHELAHFLADYWIPRTKAVERLGDDILNALDGRRPLTVAERVYALMIDATIGPYRSFMDRSELGSLEAVWQVENRADRIALALLAPPDAVLPRLDCLGAPYLQRRTQTVHILRTEFGLPEDVAVGYAPLILSAVGKGPSWLESLGLR